MSGWQTHCQGTMLIMSANEIHISYHIFRSRSNPFSYHGLTGIPPNAKALGNLLPEDQVISRSCPYVNLKFAIFFALVLYYLHQFGWHCEPYCMVCLPLPPLRVDKAEKTSRYQDVSGALKCLIDDANFQGNHTLLQDVKLCLLGP